MAVRNPVVAGMFYPGAANTLRELIATMVDVKAKKQDVFGAVLPHAGYVYSGSIAGAAVSRIKFKDTFIIIGPNHTGLGKPFSIMTKGIWKTPLGDVPIDTEMAEQLVAASTYLKEDHDAFAEEHSVEVQLPFLQFFSKDIKFVPIILASQPDPKVYLEIGGQLARALSVSGEKAVIIASSDMTHYQPKKIAETKDTHAIDAILALDPEELYRRVQEYDISMCGYAPAMVMLQAANIIGSAGAELVKYATSGDVTGENASVVGYASIIVKSKTAAPQTAGQLA
jgi:MEMO1 family protein